MASFFTTLQPRYGDAQESVSPTATSSYEQSVKYWVEAAYEEGVYEQSQSPELREVGKYIEYLNGKQWGNNLPSYKSKAVDNRMIRLFWELIGMLTDIRPIAEVKASSKEPEALKQERILNDTSKAWWLNSDADLKLAMCIAYAILTTAYGKLQWNSQLNNGEGDLELVPLGPNSVLPVKAKNTLESAEAVIYKEIQSLGWFREKYPLRGYLVQPDMEYSQYEMDTTPPSHLSPLLWSNLSGAMKRTLSGAPRINASAFPMALYREFWIKDRSINDTRRNIRMGPAGTNWSYEVLPGKSLYPRGRLIAMGGREVMYDGPNPYWHGRPPFAMLRLNVVPWNLHGMSDLKAQVDLQDVINQTIAGVINILKKGLNPTFYAPKNALSESLWQQLDVSKPGEKIAYNQQVAHEPKFGSSPQVPPVVMPFLGMLFREMDQTSVAGMLNEALNKKQVPGGDSLDMMKQTKQTPVRLKGRNIEVFLRDLGGMQVVNIMQFYDVRRRIFLLGKDGVSFSDIDWDPGTMVPAGTRSEDHAKQFKFMIQPGSLLNLHRTELIMQAMRLRQMGDMSRKGLYRAIGENVDVELIEKELKEEREQLPAMPMRGGKGGKK